jgi:hypothetical protein
MMYRTRFEDRLGSSIANNGSRRFKPPESVARSRLGRIVRPRSLLSGSKDRPTDNFFLKNSRCFPPTEHHHRPAPYLSEEGSNIGFAIFSM